MKLRSKITIPQLLGDYNNGNYNVKIFSDGTKIRHTEDDEFIADFPESMDLKISNQCNILCKFCHENSTVDGKHADLLSPKFFDTLRPWTEIAIGGGNPLAHPDLQPFLVKMKERNIIPNITVHQRHFQQNLDLIKMLSDKKLIYGLGISLDYSQPCSDIFIMEVQKYSNAVIHVINGICTKQMYEGLANNDLKILILGYKNLRRGVDYYSPKVREIMDWTSNAIIEMLKNNWFKVLSFDNLAITQLDLKNKLEPEVWDKFYMGDDGNHTMYIDLVNREFSKSSTTAERFELMDNIDDMFKIVKSLNS